MSNKKNILMLLHAYYKDDTRVRRQAEILAKNGFNVSVLCLNKGGEADFEIYNNVYIERIPVSRSVHKTTFNLIKEYLKFIFFCLGKKYKEMIRKNYDVVVVHNMPNFLIFAALPVKLRGGSIVLDMHDSVLDVYTDIFSKKKI